MGLVRIYMNKIKEMDFKRMDLLATKIAKDNNISKSKVKRDMFKNFLKYKIGYTDYFKSNYVNLTEKQKQDFLTSKNWINVINYLNPKEYHILTNDKIVFANIMKEHMNRQFLDVRVSSEEQIKEFLKGKKVVFGKATRNFGGQGMGRFEVKDIKNVKEFKETLLKNKQYLLEEAIIQHKKLEEINPYAVNTFRIITLRKDDEVHVIGNSFRIGLDENYAIQCRDTYMRLNEDGTPASPFVDDDGVIHKEHPLTHYDFTKIDKIPYVKESFELVKKAALLIPNIRYIGWDIAITEKGPVVIEGNEFPSYGLIQNYMLNPENPGHLKQIKDVIGDEFKNIKIK